ncbi:MAG: TM0996/MTH895 family glutaredoxin-like protein [Candidatus Cloacimonetes bacterium]|nr:TM0996/MTH895 family glutaredoxin-like protein [Candidatus Cloacimonadota bacterium]
MIIKVLGTGCAKCSQQERAVVKAIEKTGSDATVEKVTEINDIMDYGVMMTPALVIDEKVVTVGKVLSAEQIAEMINK